MDPGLLSTLYLHVDLWDKSIMLDEARVASGVVPLRELPIPHSGASLSPIPIVESTNSIVITAATTTEATNNTIGEKGEEGSPFNITLWFRSAAIAELSGVISIRDYDPEENRASSPTVCDS